MSKQALDDIELTESTRWNRRGSPGKIWLSHAEYECLQEVNSSIRRAKRYNENELLELWRDGGRPQGDTRVAYKWKSNSVVGVVGLPNGRQLRIRPRTSPHRFGWLVQYAMRIEPVIEERPTTVDDGEGFIDAVAALYLAELREALRYGLDRNYERRTDSRSTIRGRLQISRQLQRHGPVSTTFECRHDELTYDTPLNRALLQAVLTFRRHVQTEHLRGALERLERDLARHVSRTPIQSSTLETVELTRLNEQFHDAFKIAKYVLRSHDAGGVGGSTDSFSLLFSLSTVFEDVARRALEEGGLRRAGYTIATQEARPVTRNDEFRIIPDLLIRNSDRDVAAVGDVKWKSNTSRKPRRDDFYQLISYQSLEDAPGLVVYPEQRRSFDPAVVELRANDPLHIVELPTGADVSDYMAFTDALESAARRTLQVLFDGIDAPAGD
ncbi:MULTISPECIES: McrC family protein [Haloferax]|uniref:McrBC 5-methylcytosine restriction system component n=1 Tax=Haloferax marinum TaxID=2666143 RepID=A0A6A8G8D0_9EURY|nr:MULTISPECIES: hypothetical protein [Haloferax]KAB1198312.1 hypothetical protein Hfx1150_12635 [Haloferax sp. CBA1150]MRW97409.1 hypothetical protein [Haloferax marinum]